ncbi:MAG: ATP-dependent 6-phosphofructokinase [Verrucomicrobia bacterium]|nr:ATP-dependent 6-phosphofructokinase [Verrucomicrobiota bacterium]
MTAPDKTAIQNLGPELVPSPLGPARDLEGVNSPFVPNEARVRYQIETGTGHDLPSDVYFEKAGPREKLFFEPRETKAAIVTCGGVCPGLNNVIRSAVMEFYYGYGVRQLQGIRYGYAGLNPKIGLPPIELTPRSVSDIHEKGGTILGSSRGQQPSGVMVNFLAEQNINILLCIGGDGTLRGARDIAQEAQSRGLKIAVVGIPKTIDNDVMYISRTFGVTTATEKAHEILDCAHSEARSAYNGVGLVKLMGRDAGFIAAAATLASQVVNFCLVPEIPFVLEGEHGFLEALRRRLGSAHHAVIAVAEGAGQHLIRQLPAATDASGNKRYADIGVYLKEQIAAYLKQSGIPVDVKYFDPSYFIRSVPANCEDALLCDLLARNAVHASMAGKTNLVIGFWNGLFTHIPIPLAVSEKKQVDPLGLLWSSVLATTGQPRQWGE